MERGRGVPVWADMQSNSRKEKLAALGNVNTGLRVEVVDLARSTSELEKLWQKL